MYDIPNLFIYLCLAPRSLEDDYWMRQLHCDATAQELSETVQGLSLHILVRQSPTYGLCHCPTNFIPDDLLALD